MVGRRGGALEVGLERPQGSQLVGPRAGRRRAAGRAAAQWQWRPGALLLLPATAAPSASLLLLLESRPLGQVPAPFPILLRADAARPGHAPVLAVRREGEPGAAHSAPGDREDGDDERGRRRGRHLGSGRETRRPAARPTPSSGSSGPISTQAHEHQLQLQPVQLQPIATNHQQRAPFVPAVIVVVALALALAPAQPEAPLLDHESGYREAEPTTQEQRE